MGPLDAREEREMLIEGRVGHGEGPGSAPWGQCTSMVRRPSEKLSKVGWLGQ